MRALSRCLPCLSGFLALLTSLTSQAAGHAGTLPAIVGDWAMGFTRRHVSSTLVVRADTEGKLSATWRYDGGETSLDDFAYRDGKVRFTLNGSTYDGELRKRDVLDGAFGSDRGKTPVVAFRIGTAVIGRWDLDLASEPRSPKQRLSIRPDWSGRYGTTPIRVAIPNPVPIGRGRDYGSLEGITISFTDLEKGDGGKTKLSFSGRATAGKLTGEITTAAGRIKVVGRRAAGSKPSTVRLESRVLEFAPTRDDLTVAIALFALFGSGKFKVSGKETESEWKYLRLDEVGRNRFRLPELEIGLPEQDGGFVCMSVKVWFDKLANEFDSPYYEKVDDRYALVSYCTTPGEGMNSRFRQNRVATLEEFEAILAKPMVIRLKDRRIPSPGIALDGSGALFACCFFPDRPPEERMGLWKIDPGGSSTRRPLLGPRFAYWRVVPHRPSVGPRGTVYLSGLWQVDPDGAVREMSVPRAGRSVDAPVAVDSRGNVFFESLTPGRDGASPTVRLARLDPKGEVHIVAGEDAGFIGITAIALGHSDEIYVADGRVGRESRIRRVRRDGRVTPVAGSGVGFADGRRAAARFRIISGLAVARDGTVYVADRFNSAIRRVTPDGDVTTIAGRAAGFNDPAGVAVGAEGDVFVLDGGRTDARLLRISPTGKISTLSVLR